MKFTDNPCEDVDVPKMCAMGVGGTRLHITGTKEEIQYVSRALEFYENHQVRRSAMLNKGEVG